MEEKKDGFEVTELDDGELDDVAGGSNGNCGGCGCGGGPEEEQVDIPGNSGCPC